MSANDPSWTLHASGDARLVYRLSVGSRRDAMLLGSVKLTAAMLRAQAPRPLNRWDMASLKARATTAKAMRPTTNALAPTSTESAMM